MSILKKIDGLATIAFLAAAVSLSPVSVAGVLPIQSLDDRNGGKLLSIIFPRPSGGITEIAIEPLDFPDAYLIMVTASGRTINDAAMAAATLLTFTNLDPQTSFAGTDAITFFYNRSEPSYVIAELERAKLISPAEAAAARTALDRLYTGTGPR